MKKTLFFAAAAIAMLASCSQNDLEAPVVAEAQQSAVEFGTYLGKAATSRVGATGDIVDRSAEGHKLGDTGYEFGVYATHHVTTKYNALTDRTPNFMWNEKVYYETSDWKYDKIKYWPNGKASGTGNADDQSATSTSENYLSFFAYAPYVASASGTEGITNISANNSVENPKISYTIASDPANFVDLLWGTAGTNGTDVAGGTQVGANITTDVNTTPDPDETQSVAGSPDINVNADLTKQKVAGKVNFAFKHALSKIGGQGGIKVVVDTDDGTNETGGAFNNATTKVLISNITISNNGDDMAKSGTLDLATGKWTTTGNGLTFSEVIDGEDIVEGIRDVASVTGWASVSGKTGVPTGTATDVYAASKGNSIAFIPGTTPKLNVSITYRVCTEDTKLAIGCTNVVQTISKTIDFPANDMNKKYTLIIHLGLTGVKFTATVADWATDGSSEQTINLPINVQ